MTELIPIDMVNFVVVCRLPERFLWMQAQQHVLQSLAARVIQRSEPVRGLL